MIGRKDELQLLKGLTQKKTSSLVCLRGRRRIGKSTLIEHFGQSFKNFIEIQGLPPREGGTNKLQLTHFAQELNIQFSIPSLTFADWSEAFSLLHSLTKSGKYLIFLDEISWMGKYDPDFAGKLKSAWDTKFKHNNHLILVLCGSVSSWIKENILNNTGYVGRLSLNIRLLELPLEDSIKLIGANKKIVANIELIKLLSITGCVPKYLEEINIKESSEHNIERLMLHPNGAFFNEFEHLFNDIFHKSFSTLKNILESISKGNNTPKQIATSLTLPTNGDLFKQLDQLCEAGYIKKYFTWNIKTSKESNLSTYRISDNFIHFYLKYISPIKNRIEKLPLKINSLKNWEAIIGYQFENIIHSNYLMILKSINISPSEVVQIGPYFQRATTKQKGCQIDLLIQTKFNCLYLCEIKCKKNIDKNIETEVLKKIDALVYSKGFSIRPILIYCGNLSESLKSSELFANTISFDDLA